MRHKLLIIITVLLLGLGLTGLQAQTMYVKESNGIQTAYSLSNVRILTFSGGNATIQKTDNSTGAYTLSSLRYLNFSDITTSLDEPLSVQKQMLSAYPNPANNILNIDLTETVKVQGTLSILNFEGKTVLTRQVSSAGLLSLDISHLPKGIYICHYRNATELKTVKIIKQ